MLARPIPRSPGRPAQSNSPALTPAMNACHSAAVYRSTGLASPSFVSRTRGPPSGRSATSTQVSGSVKLDVRQCSSGIAPPLLGESGDEARGVSRRQCSASGVLEGTVEVVDLVGVGDEPASAVALDVHPGIAPQV